ncbi:hypothetical protein Efla_005353 [Eimeria flavescens]
MQAEEAPHSGGEPLDILAVKLEWLKDAEVALMQDLQKPAAPRQQAEACAARGTRAGERRRGSAAPVPQGLLSSVRTTKREKNAQKRNLPAAAAAPYVACAATAEAGPLSSLQKRTWESLAFSVNLIGGAKLPSPAPEPATAGAAQRATAAAVSCRRAAGFPSPLRRSSSNSSSSSSISRLLLPGRILRGGEGLQRSKSSAHPCGSGRRSAAAAKRMQFAAADCCCMHGCDAGCADTPTLSLQACLQAGLRATCCSSRAAEKTSGLPSLQQPQLQHAALLLPPPPPAAAGSTRLLQLAKGSNSSQQQSLQQAAAAKPTAKSANSQETPAWRKPAVQQQQQQQRQQTQSLLLRTPARLERRSPLRRQQEFLVPPQPLLQQKQQQQQQEQHQQQQQQKQQQQQQKQQSLVGLPRKLETQRQSLDELQALRLPSQQQQQQQQEQGQQQQQQQQQRQQQQHLRQPSLASSRCPHAEGLQQQSDRGGLSLLQRQPLSPPPLPSPPLLRERPLIQTASSSSSSSNADLKTAGPTPSAEGGASKKPANQLTDVVREKQEELISSVKEGLDHIDSFEEQYAFLRADLERLA